nr:PREDICTED: uncharacterized protein LOC107398905 [Tribolium castaneum]|eukprot:XP_015839951.1 PREDICTED: uncharacterized protein LOC107398905 [Tribolium castaneum]
MKMDEYKHWLQPVDNNPEKAQWNKCQKVFLAELTVLKNHFKSKNHQTNVMSTKNTKGSILTNYVSNTKSEVELELDQEVQNVEIKICALLAEHNVPFMIMDHLEPLLKSSFSGDSRIAQRLQLKRTKATGIVQNVIATCEKNNLENLLKSNKFSILVDESTDIGCVKTACILDRIFDNLSGKITTKFWELVQIFDSSSNTPQEATAENLFIKIIESFNKRNIPTDNIIGFASDGCNVMMGMYNSVSSRFKEMCPGICIYKCVCHSLHICASEACKKLPRSLEDLARNVYNYLKSSAKRQCALAHFQKYCSLEIHKLLHPSQTRWLSLVSVVARMIEQWPALQLYFNEQWLELKLDAAEQIHTWLNDPFLFAMGSSKNYKTR